MLTKYNSTVFASLSDDGTSAWGIVAEKVWAKVVGNYLKTAGGYTENGLRFLTGSPTFYYKLSNTTNLITTFAMLNAADQLNYIMAGATGSGADSTYNKCGVANGHAYSILAAFNMTDAYRKVHSMYMIRNPWGSANAYNQSWRATDPDWTNALVA